MLKRISAWLDDAFRWFAAQLATLLPTIVAALALYFSISQYRETEKEKIRADLMQHQRDALFAALQVIDSVFSNEPLMNGRPPTPHDWPIQSARDAYNMMLIYCSDPETVILFRRALGLHAPNDDSPGINFQALEDFRKQVTKELGLPEPVYTSGLNWIATLSGAK